MRRGRSVGGAALAGLAVVLVALALTSGSSARLSSAGSARAPVVLVVTETRGFHHASIPVALAEVKRLGSRFGWRVVSLATASELTPARLRGTAAVVFLLTSGELAMDRAERSALLAYIRGGGGFAGFHSASDTFHHWPAYAAMLGAEFSHHDRPSTRRVVIEDRRSPITAGLGSVFSVHEEFYLFRQDPRRAVHVLARLDTGPRGVDQPLVWCRSYGRGRVFYDALGHFSRSWSADARQQGLAYRGLRWAAGLAAPGPGGC